MISVQSFLLNIKYTHQISTVNFVLSLSIAPIHLCCSFVNIPFTALASIYAMVQAKLVPVRSTLR